VGREPQEYCNDMAGQFKEVWRALDISFDDFIQTSELRHHKGCQKFIQKVFDAGHIYKGGYEGLYCEGCESFKTEKEIKEAGGVCKDHKVPPVKRVEPCYFFALSKFQERLIKFYEENPDFIQPESRRNEVLALVQSGLQDVNITRVGQNWGIPVAVRSAVHDLRVVRRAAELHHGDRLRLGRGALQAVVARRYSLHRQGHHALPLRVVASNADGRGTRGAQTRVRAWLRLHQE